MLPAHGGAPVCGLSSCGPPLDKMPGVCSHWTVDPRLQTAVARYAGGERTARTGDEISVFAWVRDFDAWKAHDGVRVRASVPYEGGALLTARLPLELVGEAYGWPEVRSLKASRPLSRMLYRTVRELEAARLPEGVHADGGRGVVVGIVDTGGDFAHWNFRDEQGHTRLLGLWDQRQDRRFTSAEIDAALTAEDPYIALGYEPGFDRTDEEGMHGTHVMDIAAGNGRGSGVPGVAPHADLVFVHVAYSDIEFEGRGVVGQNLGDSTQLIEAIDYVFKTAGERPCVVNVSLGANGGPHDGCSPFELYLDALLGAAPNRAAVLAASNTYDQHVHATGTVAPGDCADVVVRAPLRRAEFELELWYAGQDRFSAEILVDGRSVGRVDPGGDKLVADVDGTTLLYAAHRLDDPFNHANTLGLFVGAGALGREWTVRLHGEKVAGDGRFHAWLERNDAAQAVFAAPHDDRYTVASIACGRRALVVGAYNAHAEGEPPSVYSAAGPTRDGRSKPDVSAPGDGIVAARSRTGTGVTAKSGTSMAAPAVTGLVAVLLAEARARGVSLTAEELHEYVVGSAQPPGSAWDARRGFGRANLRAALEQLA